MTQEPEGFKYVASGLLVVGRGLQLSRLVRGQTFDDPFFSAKKEKESFFCSSSPVKTFFFAAEKFLSRVAISRFLQVSFFKTTPGSSITSDGDIVDQKFKD